MPPAKLAATNRHRIQYQPHALKTGSLQALFHHERYKWKYRACFAGTGSGKTYAAAWDCLMWMLENPGGVAVFCEPDYRMLSRVMIPTFEQLLGGPLDSHPLTEQWNKTESKWTLRNGWTVWFMGLEDPKKVEGPNIDLFWVDEARLVRNWGGTIGAFTTLRRRLRGSRPGHRLGAVITTHSPTKDLVDFFEGPDAHGDAAVYRWSTLAALEAGTLPADYLEVVQAHTGVAYQAVILGEFARPEGLVYPSYDPRKHLQEPPMDARFTEFTYGVDWGYTMPAAITAIAWMNDRPWIVEEFYGTHRSIEELVAEAQRLQAKWGDGVYWCGHDRPEHIEAFRVGGLDARSNTSGVQDGIDWINSLFHGGELLIDPSCRNLRDELDQYALKPGTDKPEKGNDHACFPAGTLVDVPGGRVGIESVRVGDWVSTLHGPRRVVASQLTGVGVLWSLAFQDGSSLVATGNHPVMTPNGYTRLDALRYGDLAWRSNSTTERTNCTPPNGTTGVVPVSSTGTNGRTPTATSRKGTTSTTSTATPSTIDSQTWNAWMAANTLAGTPRSGLGKTGEKSSHVWRGSGHSPLNGMEPPKDWHGTPSMPGKYTQRTRSEQPLQSVNSAAARIARWSPMHHGAKGSAPTSASLLGVGQVASMMSREPVAFAMPSSPSTSMRKLGRVLAPVAASYCLDRSEAVYNITVEEAHHYCANGVWVSNCDSLRYGVMGRGHVRYARSR